MKQINKAIDLTGLALGIIVLAIVVSIGATILTNVRDSRLTSLSNLTTTNEKLTFSSNTATLTNRWGIGVSQLTNESTGTVITPTGNYTTSINAGDGTMTITNLTSKYQGWNATYTYYNTSRADWQVANNATIGLGEYGNWFKIIVIVGVAAVILSLIFMAFGRRGEGGVAY
jgi:hypothetical protein